MAKLAHSFRKEKLKGRLSANLKGIVHRDVKPHNIVITVDGIVKILDFGIAQLADSHNITGVGEVLGTVNYMSPEQIRGDVADARADQLDAETPPRAARDARHRPRSRDR